MGRASAGPTLERFNGLSRRFCPSVTLKPPFRESEEGYGEDCSKPCLRRTTRVELLCRNCAKHLLRRLTTAENTVDVLYLLGAVI